MITRLFNALYANAYLLLALTALFWAGNFVVGPWRPRRRAADGPCLVRVWCFRVALHHAALRMAQPQARLAGHPRTAFPRGSLFLGVTVGVGAVQSRFYLYGLNYTQALNALVHSDQADPSSS